MLPLQPHLGDGDEVSRYRVEELLARGGMGLVYRARDTRLERPVALKVLSPEFSADARFRERFVRESRLAASVDHPHVIPIYEADDWHGLLYLAMRLVHGADLHAVLATSGPLDAATTLRVLGQAAAALDAAHDAGLVHRDVKPGNLLLSGATPTAVPDGAHVYLTDFGLTKKTSSMSGITATGQFLGTLNYVPPEQVKGEDVDRRADLYSLACMTFEMLGGTPPFVRDSDAAVLWAHVFADPPPVTAVRPDLPPPVDAVLAEAMAKVPGDRPITCGEFVERLREAIGGAGARRWLVAPSVPEHPDLRPPHPSLPGGVLPDGPEPWFASSPAPTTVRREPPRSGSRPGGGEAEAPATSRRRRLGWVAAGAAVLLVAAVGLVLWRPWEGGSERVERQLVDGVTASVPEGWQRADVQGEAGFVVLAPRDWTSVFRSETGRVEAADVAASDPDAVVGVYAQVAEGLAAGSPAALVGLLEPYLVAPVTLTPGETTRLAGRDAVAFTGTLALASGEQLLLSGAVALEEPRLLVMCFAPATVTAQWRPVFEDVLASVRVQ